MNKICTLCVLCLVGVIVCPPVKEPIKEKGEKDDKVKKCGYLVQCIFVFGSYDFAYMYYV